MTVTIDGTNGVTTPDVEVSSGGSASAPAITISGDTNTGIFFPAADTIAFSEGGSEAMRIDSTGRLLVGTSTGPSSSVAQGDQARLHVQGRPGNATSFAAINLARNEATPAADNVLGYLNFTDSAGDVYASISGWVDAAPGSGDYPGRIVFETIPNGSSTRTERMRIASDGLIYTHTAYQTSGNTNGLRILKNPDTSNTEAHITSITSAGDTRFFMAFRQNATSGNASGTIVGSISGNGSNAAYNTSSDYRLKENIKPLNGALTTVAQLRPCTWTWKANNSAGQGFIAHELAEVVPDCVTGEKDAVDANGNPIYQGVDTSFLVATLTAAIQELKAINDAQASRIETLEAKVAALEAK